MSEQPNPFDILIEQIRAAVREELAAIAGNESPLLTPEQLAENLSVPISGVSKVEHVSPDFPGLKVVK